MSTATSRPPQPTLNVRLRRIARRHLVVELIGDVDVALSSQVMGLVSLIVANDPIQVDLDLRRVAFIDLGGLRAVGRFIEDLRSHAIACRARPVRRSRTPAGARRTAR